ncbi:DUF397 domain-containing protein [Streptomyces sp. NBC_01275]|uniref:DUF397 domain-containing protein n=1 Tax=Streptomyces sp. NBC_01275 TaxID=2903807 RepID=UPI002B1D7C2E|nr:DUF397 domain-containing protein [Streptomyces sp. NBC_01275]
MAAGIVQDRTDNAVPDLTPPETGASLTRPHRQQPRPARAALPDSPQAPTSDSGGDQGERPEVAHGHAGMPVRDSKAVTGPALVFSAGGWAAFVGAVRDGRVSS